MSVEKTFSITIKFERGDIGQKHEVPARTRGSEATSYTIAALSESDQGYKTLKEFVLKRLNAVVPCSQGINTAVIVGEVSEE